MRLSDTRALPAPLADAWTALNDLDVLRDALPGCESLLEIARDEFVGEMAVPLGLATSRFTVHVLRRDVQAPHRCTLHFETRTSGAGAGGSGQAALQLQPDGATSTTLAVDIAVQIDGLMAQLGAPLIELAARQMTAQFLARLGESVHALARAPRAGA